jgi:tRNA A-37 threonylcarbamoyl transferase component Bud32
MGWTLDYLGIPTPKPVLLLRYFDSQELIVFPLIQGKPLGSLLEQTGMAEQPGATRAKYWLDLMHQQGIWHGDTKAFNCLLDEKGEVWWIDLDAAGQSRFQTISRFFTGRDTRRWRQNFFP